MAKKSELFWGKVDSGSRTALDRLLQIVKLPINPEHPEYAKVLGVQVEAAKMVIATKMKRAELTNTKSDMAPMMSELNRLYKQRAKVLTHNRPNLAGFQAKELEPLPLDTLESINS